MSIQTLPKLLLAFFMAAFPANVQKIPLDIPHVETNSNLAVVSNSFRFAPDLEYDLVIQNGRVLNPETQFDQEGYHVGIKDGKIVAITDKPISGKQVIDATDLVVAPGFIDILSYDPNPLGVWNKIADGVTTNLAMHGGTASPDSWYSFYSKYRPPIHFGASFFYTQARNELGLGRYDTANAEQIKQLVKKAEESLNKGALGISFSLEYVPGISSEEILPLMRLAHTYNVPVFFHARYSDMEEPGTNFDAIQELIGYARETGASVHIDHINSTGGTFSMRESISMINEARAEGLDITACTYPYDYWGTYLNSARFDEGWQSRFRISYQDLQVAGTNERLTKESYATYKKQGKLVVAYAIPEDDVIESLKAPYVMIGSDAILEPGLNNHPRASGTFARTIGLYAREKNVISLMDAVAKMTILPAKRLEEQVPALKKKGRISIGADADVVIFDYNTIIDQSTVEHPEYFSKGIHYVIVGGQIVKDPNGFHKDIRIGQGIKSEFPRAAISNKKLLWNEQEIPLIRYKGLNYIDLEWLKLMGLEMDSKRTLGEPFNQIYSIKGSLKRSLNSNTSVQPPTSATEGDLVLERGDVAWVRGQKYQLLSINEKHFIHVSVLTKLGGRLTVEGDFIRVDIK